jgi:hypothetical protein
MRKNRLKKKRINKVVRQRKATKTHWNKKMSGWLILLGRLSQLIMQWVHFARDR